MARVSTRELRALTALIETAAKKRGILATTDRLVLSEGSQTYGRAWRLHRIPEGMTGHYNWLDSDYLGWTTKEAELSLRAIRNTLLAFPITVDYTPQEAE